MVQRPVFRFASLTAVAAIAAVLAPRAGAEPAAPSCISWSAEARYRGFAYDHVVLIRSSCEQVADCDVSTNVNPDRQRVEVPPGQRVEVVTFIGSPASEFQAHVACSLRGKR